MAFPTSLSEMRWRLGPVRVELGEPTRPVQGPHSLPDLGADERQGTTSQVHLAVEGGEGEQ